MISVPIRVHELTVADGIKSRIRIYDIPSYLTSFTDGNIQQYGTLWTASAGDSDSNGRLTENGIKFTDLFNKDQTIKIGTSTCSRVEFSILNNDHAFDNHTFGRIYIYLDVWDDLNNVWRDCPIGAFDCEKPTKTTAKTINISANDMMLTLEVNADYWFNNLVDWANGTTLYGLLQSLANQFGYTLRQTNLQLVNADFAYAKRPFYSEGNTYRKILEMIAEVAGGNAFFDHEGQINVEPFMAAEWKYPGQPKQTVTIDGDSAPTNLFNIDIATFEIPYFGKIEQWEDGQLKSWIYYYTEPEDTYSTYKIVDNPLIKNTESFWQQPLIPIIQALYAIGSYTPISGRAIMDFSIEAGDIIKVIRNGVEYSVPIFQQTWTWRGGHVFSEFMSNGTEDTNDSEQTQQTPEERKLNSFECGFIPRASVTAGSYTEYEVVYSKEYQTIPIVVASLFSNQTQLLGNCSAVVWGTTQTGCKIRVVNNATSDRMLGACWIAMENYAEPQESDDPTLGVVGVGVVGTAVVGLDS